jgi:hypothetical protein
MQATLETSAVIVTRGNVDIQPIRNTLKRFKEVVVWDNSLGPNMGPFGQFLAACYLAKSSLVYFQDDDCVTSPTDIVAEWEPGKIVCNLGTDGHAANYANRTDKLMGFGSVFERRMIKSTFEKYWKQFPIDMVTWREPGRIFTAMNTDVVKVVAIPFRNLPWATGDDRLYKQTDHIKMGEEAIRRVAEVTCKK